MVDGVAVQDGKEGVDTCCKVLVRVLSDRCALLADPADVRGQDPGDQGHPAGEVPPGGEYSPHTAGQVSLQLQAEVTQLAETLDHLRPPHPHLGLGLLLQPPGQAAGECDGSKEQEQDQGREGGHC